MATWVDRLQFGDAFLDLRHGESAIHAGPLERQLKAELASGHQLHGRECQVIAKALPRDEVVVVAGDEVALVHLTWSPSPQQPPYPLTEFADSAAAFRELVEFRY